MKIVESALPDVLIVEPDIFADARGAFLETFHGAKYAEGGIQGPFVQDNFAVSRRGVLRGLHYQSPHAQGKLVSVTEGTVFDVAVDIRKGSPTFGRWVGIELSADNRRQLYIPPGFAHGYCVLSETAGFWYKCTDFYAPKDEHGIVWNDPTLKIGWPISSPILSAKDAAYQTLAAMTEHLPVYRG